MGEKCMFQNMLNFPIEVDSKNWAKIPQKKWYDNCCLVLRLLRQIKYSISCVRCKYWTDTLNSVIIETVTIIIILWPNF